MKRSLFLILIILPYLLHAQPRIRNKKYQGLLWEISGNGLRKPSYLFGTMHVSSKMAFHLADSFYLSIRNADMVALETNPESWQEDMSKYDLGDEGGAAFRYGRNGYTPVPGEYLRINTLKFYKYDKKVERALYSSPSTINNLLYRTYGNQSSDFEEDTYLDMYIYQCGKRWGKKVAGVEKYGESMKLMAEAYRDAARDKSKKERSYDSEQSYTSSKLQEAYRSGNLDWLDSINKFNSFSAAFDEKFLYRRNEIQAASIDSILRTGLSLFVGVGAAHLPGNRGVIEILRRQGYTLRSVKMGTRDSQHKSQVEKLRVPVVFTTQAAGDGLYKVDIPGKFYKFGEDNNLDQRQYADMANGSYYMVTRIMTNAWMWGHNTVKVHHLIDSLLYENIPGKIIAKTAIVRNGNQGIDIRNRTRRGDMQRYNIFVTPFEVIIFKMSGTGDYVSSGEEAGKFFGSIQLRDYKTTPAPPAVKWKNYTPPHGGFSIDLPHSPFVGNDGSWIYDAEDKTSNTQYRLIRTDIHNYHFAEEDSFDLRLLEESFGASEFIDREISRKLTNHKGYPALDCQYRDKSGALYFTRFIIQGPHYYSLVAHGRQQIPAMGNFFNSFEIKPYSYNAALARNDTSLFYSVRSPVFPGDDKEKLDMPDNYFSSGDDEDDNELDEGAFRSKVISNDTTGEKIFVSFFKSRPYAFVKDSSLLDKESQDALFGDSSWIIRKKSRYTTPAKMIVWETVITDTGSSRILWTKSFFREGIGFLLITEGDTLTAPSPFVRSFYDSFTPVDTLTGIDVFSKKTKLYFADFMSTDSVLHKRAIRGTYALKVDSSDLALMKKAIGSLNWNEKKYLDTKKLLIGKMDAVKSRQGSDFLKELYYKAGDTLELQHAALEALVQQKTKYSYQVFSDIIATEPPVIDAASSQNVIDYAMPFGKNFRSIVRRSGYDNGSFLDELSDSLELTRTILPDLLPLLNLEDYKKSIMRLLGQMVEEKLVRAKDYETYVNRFILEAKQEGKKQSISEKQAAIRKAEAIRADKKSLSDTGDDEEDADEGNETLERYASLLLPYWDANPAVQPLVRQMLSSSDKRLKYNTMLLLLRHNKPVADSLLTFFASQDAYRYALFSDLGEMDQENKFPALYHNHLALARSKLLQGNLNDKPDSLVYIDSLAAEVKGRKGLVYFFKYKSKKDDGAWKLATVGLVPQDPARFEFAKDGDAGTGEWTADEGKEFAYSFTGYTEKKIREDESMSSQLNKELKRMLYSKRKSARDFYDKDRSDSSGDILEDIVAPAAEEGN